MVIMIIRHNGNVITLLRSINGHRMTVIQGRALCGILVWVTFSTGYSFRLYVLSVLDQMSSCFMPAYIEMKVTVVFTL